MRWQMTALALVGAALAGCGPKAVAPSHRGFQATKAARPAAPPVEAEPGLAWVTIQVPGMT